MKQIKLPKFAKTLSRRSLIIVLVCGLAVVVSGSVMAYRVTTSKNIDTSTNNPSVTQAPVSKSEKVEPEKTQAEAPKEAEPTPAPASSAPNANQRPATPAPAKSPAPQAPPQQPLKVFKVSLYSVSTYCDYSTRRPAMSMTAPSMLLLGNTGGTVTWVVEALVSGQIETGPSGSVAVTPGQSGFSIPENQVQFTRYAIRSGDAMRIRATSPNAIDSGWVYASVPICSFE